MYESERIQCTHIGSLPRPERMRELLRSDSDDADFDKVADATVREIVRKQDEVGLTSINDGEQTRQAFHTFVTDRLDGYRGRNPEPPQWADMRDYPDYAESVFGDAREPKPVAVDSVKYTGAAELRADIDRLFGAIEAEDVTPEEVFFTSPSPGVVATHTSNEYYDDVDEYIFDLANALSREYEIITDAGMTLQIDAPDLLSDAHRYYQDRSTAAFREQVEMHVSALNEALSNVPADQVRLHACWGNYPGPHHHDVPLEAVLPALYEAEVGALVVEAANPRHGHEYKAFEEHLLPEGWALLVGVVDVKTNIVEHPDHIAERIERFIEVVGEDTPIRASPDCGFASVAGFHPVYPEIVWKKLEALVAGAELANDRLR